MVKNLSFPNNENVSNFYHKVERFKGKYCSISISRILRFF